MNNPMRASLIESSNVNLDRIDHGKGSDSVVECWDFKSRGSWFETHRRRCGFAKVLC